MCPAVILVMQPRRRKYYEWRGGVLKVKGPRDVIITNAETIFREFNRNLSDPRQHGIPYDCELVGQHPGTDDALFRAHLNKLSLDSKYEALVRGQAAVNLGSLVDITGDAE